MNVEQVATESLAGTFEMFASNEFLYGAGSHAAGGGPAAQAALSAGRFSSSDEFFQLDGSARKLKLSAKLTGEYNHVKSLDMGPGTAAARRRAPAPDAPAATSGGVKRAREPAPASDAATAGDAAGLLEEVSDVVAERERAKRARQLQAAAAARRSGDGAGQKASAGAAQSMALVVAAAAASGDDAASGAAAAGSAAHEARSRALALFDKLEQEKPVWHAPWSLYRVISGHQGWVRSIAVDPSNEWFATGSADRTIKIWDLASGALKITLTGHINAVRGLAISERSPYLFSGGDDKLVKCWDLEQNRVVRNYNGHLSGIYCMAVHPTLDLLITGSRDASARVWDIRTKTSVYTLTGHRETVFSVAAQGAEPQVITGSADSVIRTWDLRTGKTATQLTHHKKSVRALALHPTEYTFASGAADNIKKWKCPEARFMMNFSGHNAIINSLNVNADGVLVSGGDNGTLRFWDWRTGYPFQDIQSKVQPGSLNSEASIYAGSFDRTGSRFITCEGDKTIKMWKEDEGATPDSHPIAKNWRPLTRQKSKF